MLTDRYANALSNLIRPYKQYFPYPKIEDRGKWESLPASLRQMWISKGNDSLSFSWPSLTATDYLEYSRSGNVVGYEEKQRERKRVLASLVLAECMEGKGRFLDQVINGIWCICEESTWVIPPHQVISKRSAKDCLPNIDDQFIDLCVGETASLLALTYYLLKNSLDQVSINICNRIQMELKRRVMDPFMERSDLWWMGLETNRKMNNWNPWINSNILTVFLSVEESEDRRIQAIGKVMRCLDRFIGDCHPDGGCDEGPVYWGRAGGSLFDCLELLYEASQGKINLFNEPLIREMGSYLYKAHIDDKRYVNFADSSAMVEIEASLVYRYGKRIHDQHLINLARSACQNQHMQIPAGWLTLHRIIPSLFVDQEMKESSTKPPFVRDAWLNVIEFMAAREQEGSSQGLYLAVKGGHNDESHNHNDIGHFLVYSDGKPFLIDVGVETYTAKTFSPERYTIWTMQSAYHNVPMVNGIQQKAGIAYKASEVNYKVHDEEAQISMNLACAYPEEAGIVSWKRTYSFYRSNDTFIEIADDFKLLQESDNVIIHLMTPCMPQMSNDGSILLQNPEGENVYIHYDGSNLLAVSEAIEVLDERLRAVWGDSLYRIILKAKEAVAASVWTMRICKE
ncbi:heparinase II/III family protein [Paenibacillus sp. MBLB4367]|uniref:heparinase II/III domain-containing protein n=1 Tax=Paenibacillus sp. MBLB4367 TaxID=3384767 RepID=UPI00390839DC